MCGIAGVLDGSGLGPGALRATVDRMAATLRHRGPDDEGAWVDARSGIALGHRRLAIVDLSDEGHQPMVSADGTRVIAYNGEIYNHRQLRTVLERRGRRFRGRSDTEVLVEAIGEWGIRGALERMNGMFAFAMWDAMSNRLYLARDRLGEKPLYYGWAGRALVFASELKALLAHGSVGGEVDRDVVAAYFRYRYVPSPRSIYRDIYKLPPATLLSIAPGEVHLPEPERYWEAEQVAADGLARPFDGTPEEAIDELDALLREAVGLRMHADVPLGAFLSGGIDSSTVVAMMQIVGDRPARTFTIGSTEVDHDEADHARAVARHLGTEHTELRVTSRDVMDVIPLLPEMYDEPFADSSQIPTYLVSRMARRDVTVSLSGDGGDELFGGYERYLWVERLWRTMGRVPIRMRRLAAGALWAVPPSTWQSLSVARLLGHRGRPMFGDKVHKLAGVLDARDADEVYRRLVSHWQDPAAIVIDGTEPAAAFDGIGWQPDGITERMMYADLLTYLPDDILAKVDRASMSVSLEARVPFLDHRVVELAWRMPLGYKIRDGRSKWLLRQVLTRYVPPSMIERPKTGFGIPIAEWLRGPLRDWVESLLDERRVREDGFLEPAAVRKIWQEHRSGRRNRQFELWDVLMFQAWLEARRSMRAAAVSA